MNIKNTNSREKHLQTDQSKPQATLAAATAATAAGCSGSPGAAALLLSYVPS